MNYKYLFFIIALTFSGFALYAAEPTTITTHTYTRENCPSLPKEILKIQKTLGNNNTTLILFYPINSPLVLSKTLLTNGMVHFSCHVSENEDRGPGREWDSSEAKKMFNSVEEIIKNYPDESKEKQKN